MTASENRSVASRDTPAFRFYQNGTEFHASAGSRLHFASKAEDTLSMPGMPAGMFSGGDTVYVTYNGTRVFTGTVDRIVDRHGRGDERVNDVTVCGPWAKLNRLVFRQQWQTKAANGSAAQFLFSRVVLNRSALGLDFTIAQQIQEILDFAATPCGFTRGTIDTDPLVLPADETRDLTCASALVRELRFHPKKIVAFDYSTATPVLNVTSPSTSDAAYIASVPKSAREYEYNTHPITAVDVQTNDVTIVGSGDSASAVSSIGHQIYPADASTTGLDVLHCYVPLAPGGGTTTYKSCELDCETISTGGISMKQFWKTYHPRLANVAIDAITISEATRTGTHDNPYLVRNAASELEAAGISFEREKFYCKCTITTADDVEEEIYLSMEFLTTSSRPKTYTWQTGSSSVAGETLPPGLAQAIYEQRTQSTYLNETISIRLGSTLPHLGDACDGLYLQNFDVDLADLTATLHFGQPDYLSAEDMRDLLNGFRGRSYSSVETCRAEPDIADSAEEVGRIPPLSSTEFSPGTKKKTTIKGSETGSGSVVINSGTQSSGSVVINSGTTSSAPSEIFAKTANGFAAAKMYTTSSGHGLVEVTNGDSTITLSSAALADCSKGKHMTVRNITWTDETGAQQGAHILACSDITIPPGSSSGSESDPGSGSDTSSLELYAGDGIKLLQDGTEVESTGTGGTFTIKAVWV